MGFETKSSVETVTPIGPRILIRKDENRKQTRGGIALPDQTEIPVISARVLEISDLVEGDENYPLHQYDKVLVNPARSIPVDFENDHLFIIPVEDVVAVFRNNKED